MTREKTKENFTWKTTLNSEMLVFVYRVTTKALTPRGFGDPVEKCFVEVQIKKKTDNGKLL